MPIYKTTSEWSEAATIKNHLHDPILRILEEDICKVFTGVTSLQVAEGDRTVP